MAEQALEYLGTESWFQVFNQMDTAIIVVDAGGTIVCCNHKYIETCKYDTLGVTEQDVVGRALKDLLAMGALEPDQSAALMCLERKEKVQAIFKAPLYKLVMSTAIPVFDQNRKLRFVVTTVWDESEVFRLTASSKDVREMYYKYLEENKKEIHQQVIIVSEPMKRIVDQVLQISNSDIPVLLLGESGVGKDVMSKLAHENSQRRDKPFIVLNCGAIPENLIESELFGYVPGAFTGASKNGKVGAFEAANGGTIMLDEIGDLPLPMQVKLLRVLENRQITRVGSVRPVQVDFRLISATNKNLLEKVRQGEFRQDLYYRINAFKVVIPSLRERVEDISALATHYLALYNLKYKLSRCLSQEAMQELLYYKWPGNIRELKNVVEQLVVLSKKNGIEAELVRTILYREEKAENEDAVVVKRLVPLKEAVAMTEIQILEMAKQVETSSYKAARVLKVDQTTVLRKLKKYDISGFKE